MRTNLVGILLVLVQGLATAGKWSRAQKAPFGVAVAPEALFESSSVPVKRCYLYEGFVVVEDQGTEADGGSFIVKKRRSGHLSGSALCDVEGKAEFGADGYFAGLVNGYVLVDHGTSPGVRGIEIRNVNEGQTLLETNYIPPH